MTQEHAQDENNNQEFADTAPEGNEVDSPPDKIPNEYQVVTIVPVELYTERNLEECREAILGKDEDCKCISGGQGKVTCEAHADQKECCDASFHKKVECEKIKEKINNSAKLQFEIRKFDVSKIKKNNFSDEIKKNLIDTNLIDTNLIEIGEPDAFIAISDNSEKERQGAEISYINTSIVLILKLDIDFSKFNKENRSECVQMLEQYGKILSEQHGEILPEQHQKMLLEQFGEMLVEQFGKIPLEQYEKMLLEHHGEIPFEQYEKLLLEQYGKMLLGQHGKILKEIGDQLMEKNGDKDGKKEEDNNSEGESVDKTNNNEENQPAIAFYNRNNQYKIITDHFSDIFDEIDNIFRSEDKKPNEIITKIFSGIFKIINKTFMSKGKKAKEEYKHLHELIDVNFAFTYFNVFDAEFTIKGIDNKERQESFVEHFADKSNLNSYAALLFELMPEASLPEDPEFIPQINGGGMNDYCSIIVRYPNRMCCFIKERKERKKREKGEKDDIDPEYRILALTIAMFSFWNRLYSFSDALRKQMMNGGLKLSREGQKKGWGKNKETKRSPYENFLNEIHKTPINIEQLLETAGYDHDAITLQRLAEASKFKSTGEIFKDDKQSYLAFHEGEMNRDHDKGRHRVNVRLQIFVVFFAIATLLVTDNFIENIGINIQDSDVWIITAAIIIIASLHIFDLIKKDWWLWCKYILSIIVAIVAVVFVIFTDYYKPESTSNSVDSTPSILVNSDDTPAN